MKTPKFIISILFASFVLLAQAAAQVGTIRVNILSSFTVGQRTMPAGDYRLSINGSLLLVQRVDGNEAAQVITNQTGSNPDADTSPRLIFHRYGDARFLSEVWIGEVNGGHQLYATPREVQLARAVKQEVVTLAALKVK